MPKLKEKPKPNKSGPRQRLQPALSSKQAAKLLRDKYLQQLEQRRPETDSTETQASGQVEDAGSWAVDELTTHIPHSPRQQERNIKDRSQTMRKPTGKAVSQTSSPAAEIKERSIIADTLPIRSTQEATGPVSGQVPGSTSGLPTTAEYSPSPGTGEKALRGRASIGGSTPKIGSASYQKGVSRPKVFGMSPKGKAAVSRPGRAIGQTARHQMKQQAIRQAQKAAKTTAATFKKAVVAVTKAASALVHSVAALAGGGVLLMAMVVVILIAAVASSPFGLFFAGERNAPDTVSVAEAVSSVNMAYNAKLEELQAGDYDSVEVNGQAADWAEVLAVFAVKTAGADGGVDVATLDADRVDRLIAVFWNMTIITTEQTPSASAFVQQRQKLLPSALETLFHRFTDSLHPEKTFGGYHLLAGDGSSLKSAAYPEDPASYRPGTPRQHGWALW